MEKVINLKTNKFSKIQYLKTINNGFKEFGVVNEVNNIQLQPSIEDFFTLYNELFYEIPQQGSNNSHEYLIKTSSEYIKFEAYNEEIGALREEINQLRQNNLSLQIENTKLKSGSNINTGKLENLQSQLKNSESRNILDKISNELEK